MIAATEHYVTEDDHSVYTKSTLIRPNFVVKDAEKSSVTVVDSLWKFD